MPRKPQLTLTGLANVWDLDPDVREFLRSDEHTFLRCAGPVFKATVASCSAHAAQILPLLQVTKQLVLRMVCARFMFERNMFAQCFAKEDKNIHKHFANL